MKNLSQLNNEFKKIKEDILYEYLVAITQKIEHMLNESYKEMHNDYILKEAHLSSYEAMGGMYGLQIYFTFNLPTRKNLEYTVSFNTIDTELCQEINCYDTKKISPKMKENFEYFQENLFAFSQRDITQMIARRLYENKNEYYYDVNLPKTWKNVTKSILGESFYIRYEKDSIEEKMSTQENNINNNKKLKV